MNKQEVEKEIKVWLKEFYDGLNIRFNFEYIEHLPPLDCSVFNFGIESKKINKRMQCCLGVDTTEEIKKIIMKAMKSIEHEI